MPSHNQLLTKETMKYYLRKLSKALVFATYGLVISNLSFGQNEGGHFKDIRVFGGMNLSSLSNEGTQITLVDSIIHKKGFEAEIGFQGGVSMTYGNHFYISPGLWYTRFTVNSYLFKAGNDNSDKPDFENTSIISMLSIPVRVGFRFINPEAEKIFNMRIFGGITGQHILSVNSSGDAESELTKDDYENLMVSATAGLGVDILFLYADLGYDLGISNFQKADSKSRHNSMFFNVGVKFGF